MSEETETEALSTAFDQYKESRSKLERLLSDVIIGYHDVEDVIYQNEGTGLDVSRLLLTQEAKADITRTFKDPSIIFVGQTNSGKSSLINEILGATVVKADDTPCTSRMVELSYGDNKYPVVQILDKDGNLLEETVMDNHYIPSGVANLQEEDRDIDRLIKSKVTAKINIPFLKSGVKIIDSPGKNENDQLDQLVDDHMKSVLPLIVYVIDGRNLLTTEEVKDIRALRASVPEGNIFFAVTKCDPVEAEIHSDEEEQGESKPPVCGVPSEVEVKIREDVYRKLMDEGILERKPISECRTYHTLSSRRVKKYRWAKKKRTQTDDTTQTIAECSRHMKDFRRFKSSLLEFAREQLIKSITDAAKIIQCSLMTCLDYFIEQSNNIFDEKVENERNMQLIELKEFTLSKHLIDHVQGASSKFTVAIKDAMKTHKKKIIEAACDSRIEIQFKIPESGYIAQGSVEEYKEALRKIIINNVSSIIHRAVMGKCQLDGIFDDVSRKVKEVQDKIEGEIPIHDALQAIFITNYTFDVTKANLTKSIWQRIKTVLYRIITFKPLRELIKGVNVTDKKWREGVAQEVLDVVRPDNVAATIIEGIVQHISQGHANFTSRLLDLRELYAKKSSLGERTRKLIRLKAPKIGYLQLMSWNIIDQLRFGEIKYGKVRGKGAQGVVLDCDAVGPNGEACVAKIINVENDNELGELALEVHYWRKLNHKNIANVYGTLVDQLMPANVYHMSIIMPRLACDLLEALPRIPDIKVRLNIALQTADALTYIHDKKMMHRDIKAANILIDNKGGVKITDFGCCKPPGMSAGSLVGTPVHVAPEILDDQCEVYSNKVDVYSFGILLWYICEGQGNHPRYVRKNEGFGQGMLYEALKGTRPERLESFSDDCWKLMKICWAQEPVERPDMKNVKDCLTRIIQSI